MASHAALVVSVGCGSLYSLKGTPKTDELRLEKIASLLLKETSLFI